MELSLCFSCQGGEHLEVGAERCTHVVVEENTVKELPFEPLKKLYVVKQEVSPSPNFAAISALIFSETQLRC